MRHWKIRISVFLFTSLLWSQEKGELTVAVDTTAVKIGEQLNYTLQVKADSTAQIVFPEQAVFIPFELLEESKIDTLRTESHYLYTKKYALIHFGEWFFKNSRFYSNTGKCGSG